MVADGHLTRHDRDSVISAALRILDEYGLPDLTMRRLGADLGVQPSALYWHFPNKQTLLAAVADRILAGARPAPGPEVDWRDATEAECVAVRDALLAYRDGAEVVLSTRALGLGGDEAHRRVLDALRRSQKPLLAEVAATALLHLVFGDTSLVQQRLQAEGLGVSVSTDAETMSTDDLTFRATVGLLLDGVEHAASHLHA